MPLSARQRAMLHRALQPCRIVCTQWLPNMVREGVCNRNVQATTPCQSDHCLNDDRDLPIKPFPETLQVSSLISDYGKETGYPLPKREREKFLGHGTYLPHALTISQAFSCPPHTHTFSTHHTSKSFLLSSHPT